MKTKSLLLICFLCVISIAYSQKILSVHPLFTEQDAVLIPEIEGLWSIPDFDMTVTFQQAGDNFYLMKYGSELNPSTFEAVFVNINNEILLDLSGVLDEAIGDVDYRNTFVKGHSIYKIELDNNKLQLFETNYSWFYDYSLKIDSALRYEWVKNAMLLTSSTAELKSFLSSHLNDTRLFENSIELISHEVELKQPTKATPRDFESISKTKIVQKCLPEFPFNNGWVGGDGDVSVPINSTTTLFLFSDSYVGNENQQSRKEPGINMVSNTVGVSTCMPNGTTNMTYFWGNMHSEHPEPIFNSHTDRYIYWVQGAFMNKNTLYVVLEKVGEKLGTAPDDIFKFSLLGFSMAKINNPEDSPNEWNIEITPINEFKNPLMGLGPNVVMEDYVYFFVNRNDQAQVLVRANLANIDNNEKHFEYYSMDKTWKAGLNTHDMDTVTNGFRSISVTYHPEMKQWVMIKDIYFLDNKIKMRTSPALTGPWSEDIVIYEIPEITPGNPLYNKSNFSYMAREHPQYYDAKKHVMVLTYDINNADYSEIQSNPKIYTPKTITIQLKKNGKK